MKITINGTPHHTSTASLADTLRDAGFTGRVATAVNGAFIPEPLRASTPLNQGDAVEVLAPMQGG